MKTLDDVSTSDNLLSLTFHGDTLDLLRRKPDGDKTVIYPLARRASIKDIVEGLGVPHTEVGKIVLDGQEQAFGKIAENGEHYQIYPLSPKIPPTMATILRPTPLNICRFLVDINVGRLAGLLRMTGCDAEAVGQKSTNNATVQRSIREDRILLTRNSEVLKQRSLVFGRLVRSQNPDKQLGEIINLYCLQDQLRPYSRCIACNGLLIKVEKEAIIHRLLPLTKKYFQHFNQCTRCEKIYWHGSHCEKMTAKIKKIQNKAF